METKATTAKETTDCDRQAEITTHIEPPEQGGMIYVRCESCGRELLEELGGRERLPHKSGCINQ